VLSIRDFAMPEPGFYGEIYNYGYTTDRLNDSSGNKIESATGAARSEFDRAVRSPRRPSTLPSKTPTRPQLLLNSAVLDRLGALAIYLRSEKLI